MKRRNNVAILVMGCALILAVNATLLGKAAWNRRGDPSAVLSLTERELAMPEYRQDENSGFMLSLRLTHQVPNRIRRAARWQGETPSQVEYPWFDRDKLEELGFQVELDPADPGALDEYLWTRERPAFVVVELDGDGWRHWLAGREEEVRTLREKAESGEDDPERLERAEAMLEWDRSMRSRLFPVDAGQDAGRLRRRYPDRQKYAVLKTVVGLRLIRPENGVPYLSGTVREATVSEIQVPINQREFLEPFMPEETWKEYEKNRREAEGGNYLAVRPPRYGAHLSFGRRYEPWLSSVEPMETVNR